MGEICNYKYILCHHCGKVQPIGNFTKESNWVMTQRTQQGINYHERTMIPVCAYCVKRDLDYIKKRDEENEQKPKIMNKEDK